MKLCVPLAAALLTSAAAALAPAWDQPDTVPGKFIVEFEDEPVQAQAQAQAQAAHAKFFADLAGSGIAASPRISFDSPLFKGASFHLHDLDAADASIQHIRALATVKAVHPVRTYSVPATQGIHPHAASSSGSSSKNRGSRAGQADTLSTHAMTGVDKMHAHGFTGRGLKIAIVDTGIDYNHPALGGCFGPGCKIAFGTDLVGDAYTGSNDPTPGNDPMDCQDHGTHVAGIIGANSSVPSFTGVAPDATLGIYRVFGCAGQTQDDVLMQAFLQAHADGADVITSSVGAASGWSEAPWAVVVSRIVDAGTPCTVAAGNDGIYGMFLVSSAAVGKGVTAVASVNNVVIPGLYKQLKWTVGASNSTATTADFVPLKPVKISSGTYPVYDIAQGMADVSDVCYNNFTVPPLRSGTIALVPYDTYCTQGILMPDKVVAAGGKAIIYYTATPGAVHFGDGSATGIDFFGLVSTDVFGAWSKELTAGREVFLEITDPAQIDYIVENPVDSAAGGFVSYYTSWGPSFEVDVKPQIAAPGGNILSTYPLSMGAYRIDSGTSMATPFVAGAMALLMQARGRLAPATITNLLAASAKPLSFSDGTNTTYDFLAPVAQQGAGLLDIFGAARTRGLFNVSGLSFNDTDHHAQTVGFEITNTGREPITYRLGYVPAGTAYTMSVNSSTVPSLNLPGRPLDIVASSPAIALSAASVTVKGGQTVAVAVSATVPGDVDLDASRIPVYGGFITLSSPAESLTLPYLGVASQLGKATSFEFAYPTRLTNTSAIPAGATYLLPPPNSTADVILTYDIPVPYFGMAMGTRVLRIDVAPVGNSSNSNSTAPTAEVLGRQVVGSVYPFPASDVPRGADHVFWYGMLADGSYVPAGSYKLLFRALKIFGDAASEDDYETVESVSFSVSYASASSATASAAARGAVRRSAS